MVKGAKTLKIPRSTGDGIGHVDSPGACQSHVSDVGPSVTPNFAANPPREKHIYDTRIKDIRHGRSVPYGALVMNEAITCRWKAG
jgi:hypothetical protein